MDPAIKMLMSFFILYSAEGSNQKRTASFPFQQVFDDDPNYKGHNLLSPSSNNDYVPNHKRNNATHTEIIFVNPHRAAPLLDSFPDLSHFEYEYDYPWEEINGEFYINGNHIEQEIPTTPPKIVTTTPVPQKTKEFFFEDPVEPHLFAPIRPVNPRSRGQHNFRSPGLLLNKHSKSRPAGLFPNFPSFFHNNHPILAPQSQLLPYRGHISPKLRFVNIPRPTPNQQVSALKSQSLPTKSSFAPKPKLNFNPHRKPPTPAQPRPKLATRRPSNSSSNPKLEIHPIHPGRDYLPPLIDQPSLKPKISSEYLPPTSTVSKKTTPKKSFKSYQNKQVQKSELYHIPSRKKSFLNGILPYSYSYKVRDDDFQVNFGATEESDGKDTQGEYYVSLPDGRLQIVRYSANNNTGYQADVSYQRP